MSKLARRAALLAVGLALVSFAVPWWATRLAGPGYDVPGDQVMVWRPVADLVHAWAVWTSLGLALAAVALMGLRIAGRSWWHEPNAWRRDFVGAGILLLGSAALVAFWPMPIQDSTGAVRSVPFWGSLELDAATGDRLRTMPVLGWWLDLAAAAAAFVAGRALSRADSSGSPPKA